MKANQYGTLTEQRMFRQGYLTSKERQAANLYGQKCLNCKRIEYPAGRSPKCGSGDFHVTINATCIQWVALK